ncbi:hypothetical protein BJ138DRAFT_1129431 [Hygrophoropsis aurantiaca]|uniref:Uncharacterized protein n=1 Tax=Hygrophoropsis aurantiaca TaxID=72124 RepID=A0ACB8A1N7_9AGAM|nr:hypothetical protein BJ138DRAFT_1129431 [Hygrophoropsis aurantiaca]
MPKQPPQHDHARAAFLRAPLGPANAIKGFPFLKYIKRKNPKKDPLGEGTYYLSVSLDQLEAIRLLAKDLTDDAEIEDSVERVESRYSDLTFQAQDLEDEQQRRSKFARIFSSSLDRDIRAFLEATRALSQDAKRVSDTVTTKHSQWRVNTRNLEVTSSVEFDEVAEQNIPPTAQLAGVSIALPPGGQIDDSSRQTIQNVADLITYRNGSGSNGSMSDLGSQEYNDDNDDAFSDRGSTITPSRYRRNSFSSITTSRRNPSPPPSPTRSIRSLPDLPINIHGTVHGDIILHFNYYLESQVSVGESVNPTLNTRSSGTQGATISNPIFPKQYDAAS